MELLESLIRVTWDPDGAALVLVDFGAPMWELVRIAEGQQAIDTANYIRALGAVQIPRRLDSHSVTFTLALECGTIAAAQHAQFAAQRTAPRGMADVRLSIAGAGTWRIRNAAVQSWPGGESVEHIASIRLQIIGGEMVSDTPDTGPGTSWEDRLIYTTPWESIETPWEDILTLWQQL